MPSNRRRGIRNKFEFKKNYIIPLICIIITCISVVTCTIIVVNVRNESAIYINNEGTNQESLGNKAKNLSSVEKTQINSLISFLMSNLDFGQDLNDNISKYILTCKYYGINNEYLYIPDVSINELDADTYREFNYVYFNDYKEQYKYISKENFEKTYSKLFNLDSLDFNNYSKYYISSLNGYLVPKNVEIYENVAYKIDNTYIDNDKYIGSLMEINMYKLYEEKELEEINNYLKSDSLDQNFTTGNSLKISFIKQNDIFVFDNLNK